MKSTYQYYLPGYQLWKDFFVDFTRARFAGKCSREWNEINPIQSRFVLIYENIWKIVCV